MSDPDAVIKIDPALRVAREIAKQDGVPKRIVDSMYEKAVLGETQPTEMLVQIKQMVTSSAAKQQVQAVIDTLPQYVGNEAPTVQQPIANE